jgi:SM-20-related protein
MSGCLQQVAAGCTRHLQEANYVVVDGLLSAEVAAALRAEIVEMHAEGKMEKGQVNNGKEDERGDLIRWIDPLDGELGLKAFARIMDLLVLELTDRIPALQRCSMMRDKAMATLYPANANGYTCHVDNDNKAHHWPRVLTCILYLNRDWRPEAGGQLRLHLDDFTHTVSGLLSGILLIVLPNKLYLYDY